MDSSDILALAQSLGNDPLLMAGLLFATTFLLEDAAALAAAFLIAEGLMPPALGYGAVAGGIFLGDLWLYGMGSAALQIGWLRRRIGQDRLEAARLWLDKRLIVAVAVARVMPTVRLPTYVGLGYTKVSFRRFAAVALVCVAAWTVVLFAAADLLAALTQGLGPWRWAVFAAVVVAAALLPYALKRAARLVPSGRGRWSPPAPFLVLGATLLPGSQERWGGPGPDRRHHARTRALPVEHVARGGHEIALRRAGDPDGRPVLLLHGTPGSSEGWARTLLDPPPGFHFVAVDRPGFGRTRPNRPLAALEDQADALAPLLARLGKDGYGRGRPILLGHSLGGPLATLMAIRHGAAVAGLVVAGGALDPALERVHPLQRAALTAPLCHLMPRALDACNRELVALRAGLERLSARLDGLGTATEIVHGDADDLVPVENVAYMRARFANVSRLGVTVLPGRDHFLPWKEADALHAALARLADDAPD